MIGRRRNSREKISLQGLDGHMIRLALPSLPIFPNPSSVVGTDRRAKRPLSPEPLQLLTIPIEKEMISNPTPEMNKLFLDSWPLFSACARLYALYK
jgi:hypothetical protein